MIGIVYLKANNQIIAFVPDVVSCTDTDINGKGASVKGIDLTQASFCIVASTTLQIGDTLGTFTDTRHLLPKTPQQKDMDKLTADNEQMNLQIIDLFEQLVTKGVL